MQQIPSSLQSVAPFISHYGYIGLFALLFIEDFGVPVPGETMLIAAAVFAGLGRLNIVLVIIVGIAAAFIGDNLGYAIGNYVGDKPLRKYGKYVLLTPEKIDKATSFFDKYGGRVVVIARFIEGLRQLNGILSGISSMKWRTFAVYNALGATLWVTTWSMVGYLGGSHIDAIEHYGSLVAVVALVALLVYILFKIFRSRRAKSKKPARQSHH